MNLGLSHKVMNESILESTNIELVTEAVNFDANLEQLDKIFKKMLKTKLKNSLFVKEGNQDTFVGSEELPILKEIETFIKDKFNLTIGFFLTRSENHNASVMYSLDYKVNRGFFEKVKKLFGFGKPFNPYLDRDLPLKDSLSNKEIERFKDGVEALVIMNTQFIGMEDASDTKEKYHSQLEKSKSNPREITALLLHELGHLIYLGDYLNRVNYTSREIFSGYRVDSGSTIVNLLATIYSAGIFPLYYMHHNRKGFNQYQKFEVQADSYAVKYGYGPELAKALSRGLDPMSATTKNYTKYKAFWNVLSAGHTGVDTNLNNSSLYERLIMMRDLLKRELNDSRNSKLEKKKIREQIEYLDNILKDLKIDKSKTYKDIDDYISEDSVEIDSETKLILEGADWLWN